MVSECNNNYLMSGLGMHHFHLLYMKMGASSCNEVNVEY